MYGVLNPLVRALLRQVGDFVSPPIPPAPDYISPPLSAVDLRQMSAISELAKTTGDIDLLTYEINMHEAYMRGDASRVRQEMIDAARRIRIMFPNAGEILPGAEENRMSE
jgi:hypothetical protein